MAGGAPTAPSATSPDHRHPETLRSVIPPEQARKTTLHLHLARIINL